MGLFTLIHAAYGPVTLIHAAYGPVTLIHAAYGPVTLIQRYTPTFLPSPTNTHKLTHQKKKLHTTSARERPDGYNEPSGPGMGTEGATYADQDAVFNDLGKGVLNNAYEGFNSCLFAYGQTGSGKSYSMVGYGQNKGIVPISCDAIFKKIEEDKAGPDADKFQYQVISMN